MIKLINTISLIFVLTACFGQSNSQINSINLNTKFTLTLHTTDSINYTCTLKNQDVFNNTINMSETASLFDSIVSPGEIQGIFTYGKFGDNLNIFLVLKSGFKKSLDYELLIKVGNKRKPIKTSVVSLFPNVPSTELWPYQIDYIVFSKFKIVEQIEYSFKEPIIDSTCIKNTQNNTQSADSLFSNFVDLIYSSYLNSTGLKLDSILDFEHSINSSDETRDYYTSIGEGIYPNEKSFKLEKPFIFRHIECPYFQTDIEYYYTKSDKSVKVIMLEWNEYKKSNGLLDEGLSPDVKSLCFREKYNRISKKMTEVLGAPIFTEIESEKKISNFRDDIKWKSKDGVTGYLFMFGNDSNNYRQIRLAIYKD